MINKSRIDGILSEYYKSDITLGVVCSHSALQLIHGAKLEGFKTIGICPEERKKAYASFPRARPDDFLTVETFDEILEEDKQEKLIDDNVVMIPHGSFVEYIGAENLLNEFEVPIFGNRASLKWEGTRKNQRKWLKKGGAKMPKLYEDPSEIDERVFVKFSGAKGGKGFFTTDSPEDFQKKLDRRLEEGLITEKDVENYTIQEFVPGVRYYPHYFFSIFDKRGAEIDNGALEILGMDRRVEPIDEIYRALPDIPSEFFDYSVTGNEPLIVREKFLVDLIEIATGVVEASKELFPPGIIGPFCLETIYHPRRGFTVFEISGRIVAGTNLYPMGSPYSFYYFEEPMSTGRRIAREIKKGIEREELNKIVY